MTEKAADVQRGQSELPNQDTVPINAAQQAADSSALQTSAGINEVIPETFKWRAKEFMNLSLQLLTVHRQVFQKQEQLRIGPLYCLSAESYLHTPTFSQGS